MTRRTELDLVSTILQRPGVMAAILAGSVVLGLLAVVVAARLGWARVPAALAGCGLALALGVTLVRSGAGLDTSALRNPLDACIRDSFSLDGSLALLNFAMLMPLGFFATLASRRPFWVIAFCAVLSCGIEITQAVTSTGVCQKQDVLNNSIGGAVAALAAWALLTIFGGDRPRSART